MNSGGGKNKSYKAQIRGLNRVLNKMNLDEKARAEIKQKIADLEARSNITTHREERKKNKEIHKKFKFFDRKKLSRRIEQIEKQLSTIQDDSEEKQKLLKELEECHKKMDYIQYYPNSEYYISLYPTHPYSEDILHNQKTLMEITQSIKNKAESLKQEFLDRDIPYRKREFKKALEILSTLKHNEEHKDIIEEPSSDLDDDDFFMNGEDSEEALEDSSDQESTSKQEQEPQQNENTNEDHSESPSD